MLGVVIAVVFLVLIIAAGTVGSVLNSRELKWRLDPFTQEGLVKLQSLDYDTLKIIRRRLTHFRRGYNIESDYTEIALNAPLRTSEKNDALSKLAGTLSFTDKDDELCLFAYKNAEKHLVYTCTFTPEALQKLRAVVEGE